MVGMTVYLIILFAFAYQNFYICFTIMADLLESIADRPDLAVFAAAIKIACLEQVITNDIGEFTIFAPTDLAFAKLPGGGNGFLDRNIWVITEIVSLHTIFGRFGYDDLLKICDRDSHRVRISSIDGSLLTIDLREGIVVENAKVTASDPAASNGMLHIIDRVLLPSSRTL
jgi:uncharacterized surface protein with fasciclin (FAS1) repeats